MAVAAQLIFVLFSLVSISVSSDVVRLVGDSVQLDIQDPVPEFDDLTWVFNKTNNLLKYVKDTKRIKLYPDYKDRVEFNDKTYSLTLKNLQKTDSGPYEVIASGEKNTVAAEYRLSVLEEPSQHDGPLPNWLWAVVVILVVLIILLILLCIYMNISKRKSADPVLCEDTVYEEIRDTGVATRSMGLETNSTVYSIVGQKPQPSSNGPSSRTTLVPKNKRSTSVESNVFSIYETISDQTDFMKSHTIYVTASKPKP